MNIELASPLFLILLPICIVLLIFTSRYMRMKNKNKKIKYIVLRSIICTLIVLCLCGITVKSTSRDNSTIFLVDLSDSDKNSDEEMAVFIHEAIAEIPKNNTAGIITFGSNTAIEQFITDKKLFSEFQSEPVSNATNIEDAISQAIVMFPENSAKRIVLITDGLENDGDVNNMTSSILLQDIDFKVLKIDKNISDEVFVSDLEIPDTTHIGDNFNVKVTIKSNVATNAVVSLYSGRTLKSQTTVKLETGENQFVFNDIGDNGGLKSYRVVVEPEKDTISINNEYVAFTQVEAQPRILLIEGKAGQGNEFAKILDTAGFVYDKVTPTGAPTNMGDLTNYKSVICLDVYYDDLKKDFVNLLESYVKDYAGGFIAIGGSNSYALGAYRDTPLEEVLPVYMDLQGEKEIPKTAMLMIIDHSGSMTSVSTDGSNVSGLDLAKQAAIQGLSSLRPIDQVGVMSFDDSYSWVVDLQDVGENVSEYQNKIASIEYGGGTSIYPAVDAGANKLLTSDAQIKHIILLSDGQDSYSNYESLYSKINDSGITLSTVAIGEEADSQLLNEIADMCGGRYYYTDINNGIPRIFAQEVFLSTNTYLINEEFTPVLVNNSEIVNGLFDSGSPSLLGYIAASPKETATVILESHRGDPVLSTWQCGLGRTVAWNSDGTNEWTGNFAQWENYTALWKNIIDYTVSNTELGDDTLNISQSGSSANIIYTTKDYDSNTKVTAVCTDEEGNVTNVEFDPIAPGEYESSIPLEELGVYSISIKNQKGEEIQKSINTATAMQYSPEYRFDIDDSNFTYFVEQVGGKYIETSDQVFNENLEKVIGRKNLTVLFMILALILLMIDIISRRLNLSIVEGFIRKNTEKRNESKLNRQSKPKSKANDVNSNNKQQSNNNANVNINNNFVDNTNSNSRENINKNRVNTDSKNKKIKNSKTKKENKKQQVEQLNVGELLKKKNDRDL